ncbi:longitudinals lacking protein, isoforms N/O/W/X/Y isoform X7 [Cephus cinctus]|uniref:Longitudinals lacking protein, isoforms N/O/W/X/Y isoform X7 n=1 Tax=Cephus cinctus TaxID=211228 RepID=A0AAJ7VY86_CEPCN|nr:longitudinals lacking protein, isoforms N/O/W/X/Y isoform X7 [Cephus cinctus]
MEDDQQFCLRWNNHQSTLVQNFDTLLESGTLVDCTLAAEGKSLKAHKVVLSACSPFFEGLLSEHYDKHPVFILKDIKFKELKAMMDYMYKGEVNISQDQLAALLKAAESLQIKGLSECKTSGNSGGGGCGGRSEPRPPKVVSQPTAPSLDIPHPSSGLTIEKNSKVPRQSLTQVSVGDLPEDSASPQLPRGLSSREGSQSPTNAKRKKRFRGRSLGDDNSVENHDASNSSDMPQQMGVSSLAIAPVANEKSHADPTDSLGSSVLMQQLAKPADEMLQMPLENQQPNDNLIEPKSEYLEDPEESVEDLTLDDDMNDLNEMEQDTNRAGPSHESSQHPGLAAWHVTGDRSNAGGVVGSVAGAPGTNDEVFLAAQEAAQAHRDSQGYYAPQLDLSFILQNMPKGSRSASRDFRNSPNEEIVKITTATITSTSTSPVHKNARSQSDKNSEIKDSSKSCKFSFVPKVRKPFACPRCPRSFSVKGNMTRHLKYECGQSPRFQCPYCEFRNLRVLGNVMNYPPATSNNARGSFCHPTKSLFYCPKCNRGFTQKSNRNRHFKNECGQEPKFKCPYCDLRSKQTSQVYSHIRKKHPGHEVYYVDTLYLNKSSKIRSRI